MDDPGGTSAPEDTGTVRIPLFPLGMVLFPGLLLPLNVFEPRYRALVEDLLALPEGAARRFGVVAIRHGRETGADSVDALYEIGTTATLSRVERQSDGRYELLTVGTERFRLHAVDRSQPYLQGDVEILGDPRGADGAAEAQVPLLLGAYHRYLEVLGATRSTQIEVPELPADPQLLSWLVAATVLVDLSVRQSLLDAPDTASRLTQEIALLRSETGLLRTVAAAPAPEFTRAPQSPN